MNTFNRFLVILICLTAICLALGAMLLVWASPGELGAGLRATTIILRDKPFILQVVITAFSAGLILVALLILAGEFTSQEPASIPLTGVSGGGATVSMETVAGRVKTEAEAIPGVQFARPLVRRTKGGVDAVIEVRPEPDAHLPTTAAEIREAVRRTLEDRLGVAVKDVRVSFQPDRDRARARPTGDILVPGGSRELPPPPR